MVLNISLSGYLLRVLPDSTQVSPLPVSILRTPTDTDANVLPQHPAATITTVLQLLITYSPQQTETVRRGHIFICIFISNAYYILGVQYRLNTNRHILGVFYY